jgi:hypothetical protein
VVVSEKREKGTNLFIYKLTIDNKTTSARYDTLHASISQFTTFDYRLGNLKIFVSFFLDTMKLISSV